MELLEKLIQFVCISVKEKCMEELKLLGRKLTIPTLPFKRITHKQAVELAIKLGYKAEFKKELPWLAEHAISLQFKQPFFIIKYPKGSRGFYDKTDGEELLDFDLIYDSGFGEGASGSEREYEYEKIVKKIKDTHLISCQWYLQEIRRLKPTAGFGIGLERLTRYICGLESIADSTPFPRLPGGTE
jgi:asparaginyl-tRNA synthetase